MPLIFLLLGCVVGNLATEYEDFDDQYSYDDDDDDEEGMVFPGIEPARIRRDDHDTDTQGAPGRGGINGVLNQIMSGRKMEDFISEYPFISKKEYDYDLSPTRESYDLPTPIAKEDNIPAINRDYDLAYVMTPNQHPWHVNVNTKDNETDRTINAYTPITKGEDTVITRETETEAESNNVTASSQTYPTTRTTLDWSLATQHAMENKDLSYVQEVTDVRLRDDISEQTITRTETTPTGETQINYNAFLEDDEDATNIAIVRASSGNTNSTGNSTNTETTTDMTTTQTTQTVTTTTKATTRPFDIEKFLEIIANLTYDYDTNLTMQVNETLKKLSWPTCGIPTIGTTTTTELVTTSTTGPPDYAAINHTLMGKCFVCGLQSEGIPYEAHCADAFAGDFIPLVPQDPRAKGQLAAFRKYCRYLDVDNFAFNLTMPRSIFGRWTGGCSVRWTDMSGVYTQRSCRNKNHATTGRHFASKRMAKLEMALSNVDNGCIISPVATLLPLSRGISLFARFHACVCTGNWCNSAPRVTGLTAVTVTIFASVIIAWLNRM